MSNSHGGKRKGSGRKKVESKQLSLKVPTVILNDLNDKFTTVPERNIEIVKVLSKLSKKQKTT